MTFKVVGQSVTRYDGLAHVTGETKFVDDVYIPGTLAVKAYRSPVHKGRIKSIDTSAAERMAGVAGVITHRDVPKNTFGWGGDQPVLAGEAVRFKGETIAAVAAVDEDTAMEAIERIRVEIEEEEPVFDPLEAMQEGAPLVRPEGNVHWFGDRPFRRISFGSIEAAFEQADEIIEGRYFHPVLEHAQMEPMASLAVPEARGGITIYSVSQSLSLHQGHLAAILGLPMHKVRLVGGTVGGSFGAKTDIHADPIAGLLALKTGQPVKWRWTRAEDLMYSTFHGAWIMEFSDAVTREGRILGRKIKTIRDAGAYLALNEWVVDKHCFLASGPYYIPNVYVEGHLIYTNKPPASAMRGFGITPAAFAGEIQINRIAEALGKDRWEIRFINAYREGEQTATGRVLDSVAMIETLQTLAVSAGVELPEKLTAMSSQERRA